MAPIAAELATLRALSFRISSTPPSQLPQHVTAIAASLATCRSLLSSAQNSASKASSEASVVVHKYRTLLSTLLQDRSTQGRWAAIVLVKATVENGGWETLQRSLPWVRGLLGLLTKSDPPSAKKLCIITLTRIFLLTREYPTLVREITTPSLPTFIQTCLQIANSGPPTTLLQVVLQSFNQLLPRHPTIFRSHIKPLQQLLSRILAPTPTSNRTPGQDSGSTSVSAHALATAARQLHTQLPCTAPKGASSEEWQASFGKTLENAHRVANKVFRAVMEDWSSVLYDPGATNGTALEGEVEELETDSMGLPPWSGIFAGGERLVSLLRLIKDYLECATPGPVSLNVGAVMDLVTRMLSLTIPTAIGNKNLPYTPKFNNQISKEERDNLWLILPHVHVAAIEILSALEHRCDRSVMAVDAGAIDQLVWVFSAEKDSHQIRTACYRAVAQLLARSGVSLPKGSIDSLGPILRKCCQDVLPQEQSSISPRNSVQLGNSNGNTPGTTNADAFLDASKGYKVVCGTFSGLYEAAYALLPAVLLHTRSHYLSDSLRTRIDRTAILVGHKDAMIASVLNPPSTRKFGKPAASIMPLLARSDPGEKDVEALLRPRMPVIYSRQYDSKFEDEGESEEEGDEDGLEFNGDENFVGDELGALLETAASSDPVRGDTEMAEVGDGTALATNSLSAAVGNTTNIKNSEAQAAARNAEPSQTGDKRLQDEDAPLSPSKRARMDEGGPSGTVEPASTLTTSSAPWARASATLIQVDGLPTNSMGPPTVMPAAAQGSAAAQVPALENMPADGDSDDEDIVPLVLGQDTDEESD